MASLLALFAASLPVRAAEPATGPFLLATMYDYEGSVLPSHFLNSGFDGRNRQVGAAIVHDSTPADNPVTNAGATLGRVLFYDRQLSAKGTISCSSCHLQQHGFSDPRQRSVDFEGGFTRRNSMSLANARFNRSGQYFWDERAETLEAQALMPFQDPVEMGLSLDRLVEIVAAQPYYPALFQTASRPMSAPSARPGSMCWLRRTRSRVRSKCR